MSTEATSRSPAALHDCATTFSLQYGAERKHHSNHTYIELPGSALAQCTHGVAATDQNKLLHTSLLEAGIYE